MTEEESSYPVPFELYDPPRSSRLGLFHAVCGWKNADVKFTVSKINKIKYELANHFKIEDLEKYKSKLQKLFTESNNGIRENRASRLRFQEKIVENQFHTGKLQDQILNIKMEILHYKKVAAEMEKYVEGYSLYENFLESVAQVSPEFNSGGDILNRFETLESTRMACSHLVEQELEGFSEMKRKMITLLETKSTELKDLDNRIVAVQVQHKQAKERRMFFEHAIEGMKLMIEQHKEGSLVISGGCWDLYQQICTHRKIKPKLSQSDLKGQLDFIEKEITFMKEVSTLVNSNMQVQKK
ncbi:uncharacterized protein LOC124363857 [Homalodisca vitripennis]|uniref:uncharacterized protein LOC124363857 n=1 Tax=Homalodisca vitripennis TaxID=197043 RepID=UPI001EEB957A|nr:uncharacterized protein LOC124363857 [Homalodisca vitripennis]KAG8337845.1 Coiled-coil domain-containing protein 42 [Homalodisca vitripennis]